MFKQRPEMRKFVLCCCFIVGIILSGLGLALIFPPDFRGPAPTGRDVRSA